MLRQRKRGSREEWSREEWSGEEDEWARGAGRGGRERAESCAVEQEGEQGEGRKVARWGRERRRKRAAAV